MIEAKPVLSLAEPSPKSQVNVLLVYAGFKAVVVLSNLNRRLPQLSNFVNVKLGTTSLFPTLHSNPNGIGNITGK